ncbi:hypothetical protein BH09BAC1_BH09BAC1_03340 [soil metagenome]
MLEPIEETIAKSPQPRITDYFTQGFNIVFKKPLYFIAAILMIVGFSYILGFIQIAGDILQNLIFQPLLGLGIYIAADKINYLEDISLDTFFKGFRENFIQVVLTSLLMLLVMALPLALIIYGYIKMFGLENFQAAMEGDEEALNLEAIDPSGATLLIIFAGALLLILVALLYIFAIPMVRFKSLGPWQAMEASRKLVSKHFVSFVLFLLFAILVNLAGLLLLVVGLFITIPATYAAIYVAFDDLVGARPQEEGETLIDHLVYP